MERIQIVKDALEGEYDEFYDDYVSGKKELSEINRENSEQFAGCWTSYRTNCHCTNSKPLSI